MVTDDASRATSASFAVMFICATLVEYDAQLPTSTFFRSTTIGIGGCGLICAEADQGARVAPIVKASNVLFSMAGIVPDVAVPRRQGLQRGMSPSAPGPQVEFRYARGADCVAIVALVESAYRGETSRVGWTTEADLLGGQRTDAEDISSVLAEPDVRLLLATEGDTILGTVLLRRESDGLYLGMLAVQPRLQSIGLGRRLLAEAEARGRQEFGARRARMTVIEQRGDLIAWYERRGYARTGQTEPFPYDNPRFGMPKRDDLRFVVLAKDLD